MSGIIGLLDSRRSLPEPVLTTRLREMATQLPGPARTDQAIQLEPSSGLGLAVSGQSFASDTANLTALVASPSGRFSIALTGTNSPLRAIRSALGRSGDARPSAALLAAAVEDLGIARVLQLVDGPLALAVWDRAERTLTIGRDRYGQETLYAGWAGPTFLFASRLFSLATNPGFSREIDRGAVAQFLRYSQIKAPNTILCDAVQLRAGAVITVRADRPGAELVQTVVASVHDDALTGIANRFTGSQAAATDALDAAVRTAFRDATANPTAPIGIFFSGGLDSTLLAATAAAMGERPVHAITAGFHETAYDEASQAAEVARHIGVEHHIVRVTADDMCDLLPKAARIFQEPFGDTAALPAIKLAEATRGLAPMIVTGDGGDELFMGYPDDKLWDVRDWMRGPVRPLAAHALDLFAAGANRTRRLVDTAAHAALARYLRPSRIRKAAAGLHANSPEAVMQVLHSDILHPGEFLAHPHQEPLAVYDDPRRWLASTDRDERWRYIRFFAYTVDREIPKHQRSIASAGMAYRSLLMHPAITSLAWSLPPDVRDPGGVSRGLMRDVITRYVPRSIFNKPKAGFNVPFDRWFRGPLRPMMEELLAPHRIAAQGIFDPAAVSREVAQHLTGKYDRRYVLFDLMMFQLWLESLEAVPRSASSVRTIRLSEARRASTGTRDTIARTTRHTGGTLSAAD
jgi:asparagine synthase (glutamine-hydrolysing)